jgi:hypothetical protein
VQRLYERSSRTLAAASIDSDLRKAIAAHAEEHLLGDVIADALACCETRSVRQYRIGLFARLTGSGDPDREHRSVALLTPRYLVVAVTGVKRGTQVMSARLDGASIGGTPRVGGTAVVDNGISVSALWSGWTDAGAYYIGLGDDSAGLSFLQALRETAAAAKRA